MSVLARAASLRLRASLDTAGRRRSAWLPDGPPRRRPNAGVVVDPDGVTVIDTLMVPDQYEPFAAEVEAIGLPVRRAVLTGSGVEQAGGTGGSSWPRCTAAARRASTWTSRLTSTAGRACSRRPTLFDAVVTRPVSHVVASTYASPTASPS